MADLGCTGPAEGFRDEAGFQIVMARHTGFLPDGSPIFAQLNHLYCLATPPTFPHARHVNYLLSTNEPVFAEGWECCDAFCTDAEEAADECYVEEEAWPLGPGPGITRRVRAYITYRHPCSHNGISHSVLLEYDPLLGKWLGTIPITNGTLCLAFSVDPLLDFDDAGKFILEYQRVGCTDPLSIGIALSPPTCVDPLLVHFDPFGLPLCCPGECDPPEDAPNVLVTIRANCRKTLWARHVGFEADGSPIWARPKECPWNFVPAVGCCEGDPPGDLLLSVTQSDTCCISTSATVVLAGCDHTTGLWSGSTTCGGLPLDFYFRCTSGLELDGPDGGLWQLGVSFNGQEVVWVDADTGGEDCPIDHIYDLTNVAVAQGICSVEGILVVQVQVI